MELIWSNPSPNRTVYRSPVWEVIRTNGTSRVIHVRQVRGIADLKLGHGAKEIFNDLQTSLSVYFCF